MRKLLLILSFSMIALLDWAQVQNACFSSRNDISFSRGTSNTRGIVQGDFDGDGMLDIVTTTYGSGPRFSFQKGLGNGKFGSPITGGLSGSSTLDIEKADFNGDGKLDIVYANLLGVHIYTGQGNGSFDSLTFLPLTSAKFLTVGDFNEDGAIDIVASTGGVTATANVLFLGTPGNPTLFTSVSDPTFPKPATAGAVCAIGVADMNNDNHLDIVFLLSGGVRVYLNQPASLGNFTPQTASGNITGTPNYMTVVDLNNDGNKDVVVSRSTSNLINVFFGNGLGSVGTTAASISYPTENYPCGLKHYDINQDGFMDIVVLNSYSSTMSIYYGSASGALTLHQTTQCPGAPRVLVVDQFTADTHADIVTAQVDYGYINSFVGNASHNYLQPNLVDVAASPSSSFAGDFNGDGKQDVAITHTTLDQVQIWLGNGTGGFTAGATLPTGTEPVFITGGDLNGNGTVDLVVVNKTSDNVTVFYGSGTGTFPTTLTLAAGDAPVQAKIGNLNGDANLDIVVVNNGSSNFSAFLATSATTFAAAVNVVTSANPQALAIGDLDGNGTMDVAVGYTSGVPSRFSGDGAGGFATPVNITNATLNISSMEIADLDGDGDGDLVVGSTAAVYRIHNPLSTSAITNAIVATSLNFPGPLINPFGSGNAVGIKIVDVNNDGKLDVVGVYNNSTSNKIGTIGVAVATAFGVNNGYVLTPNSLNFATEITASGLAMADFNSDGRIDAVVPNQNSNSFTLHLNTTPVITAAGPTTFCNGNSVVLNGTAASQWYEWSPTNETTQNITATTDAIYTLTSSSSWSDWCSAVSDTLKVTVTPGPAATTISSPSTVICGPGSITLTSTAGAGTYQWYKDGVAISGATSITYAATTSGIYTVRVVSGGCSSDHSNQITISVAQTPVITAGGPTTFCAGGSVVLTSDVASNITWSPGGQTTSSITVTTSGTYSVTNNVGGCPSLTSNSIIVTVTPAPPAPTISPSGTVNLCTGQSVTLVSSASTGNVWSTTETTQNITVNTAGTYTVQQVSGGCSSLASAPVTVVIHNLPATPTITAGGSTTFCTGGSVVLTAPAASSYLWSPGGQTTQSITVTTSGSHSVVVTNAAGCSSLPSNVIPVTVNPLPATPTITAGGPTTFCAGGSVVLTAPTSTSYLWSNSAVTQSITVTASDNLSAVVTDANGCTSLPSNVIPVTVNALPATPTITAGGSTTFCDGASVVLTAPASSSYLWSPGNQTTQSITVTTSGSHSVVVTNAAGCTSAPSNVIPVTVNPLPATPTITAGGPTTFCAGGSVVLTSTAGPGYLWSPGGQTTQSITVTTSGNYSVKLVSGAGCESLASNVIPVTVNALPATPIITAGGATTFCDGASVVLTAPTSTSYLWSPGGQTTQSITVTTSGSHSVVVTNAAGCSSLPSNVIPVTVNALPATPTITAGGSTTFCAGGSVVLSAPTSTSYLWSPGGQTTQTITVTTSGSYSVVVANAAGCSSAPSNVISVTVNPLPATPTITAGGPTTFCAGGSVVLTAPTSTTYSWSNGATTQSITVIASDNLSAVVTDANGCTSLPSNVIPVTVNPLPATPTITAGGPTTFCAGGSVVLTAPAAASYLWSPGGQTTQSITVTTSGSYSVVVSSGAGCASATSNVIPVTVNALPATPTITAGGPTTFCAGGSVVLTAPVSTSYLWTPSGQTTQSITVTTTGSHSVKVTDANGCTSLNSVAVPVTVHANPTTPTITAGGPTTFCDGGSVVLTAPPATSYLWSTGAVTQSITVTTSDNISVQVTNANGCTSVMSVVVPVTVNPIPTAPTITPGGPTTFCSGGSVTLTSSASANNLWSTGSTNQTITVTTSGTYTVNTTVNGCTSPNATQVITVNSLPAAPTITASGSTTFCVGDFVTLSAPTSTSYLWFPGGQTTQSINVTTSGSYSVQITNVNGCTSAMSVAVPVTVNALPATPTITVGGATTFCLGGSVTLTAPTSTSYLWSNGATTQSINVTLSGSYTVKVKNAAGCESLSSAAVDVTVNPLPAAPTVTAGGPVSFCIGGSVVLSSTPGTSYIWSNGAGNVQNITVTTNGTYTAQITDGNGCTSLASNAIGVTVYNIPTAPIITPSGSTTFCDGNSINLTSSPGTTYLWSTGETTQTITVTTSGSYWVKRTNTNGCESPVSATTIITVNPIPTTPAITASGATAFCSGGNVVLTSSANTGNTWSTGPLTQSITVSSSGTYSVTVTENGCTSAPASQTVTVFSLPATPTITAGGPTTFCIGDAVTLTSSAAFSYEWSTGATTQSIVVTTAGNYSVKVINANGCSSAFSTAVPVTVNPLPAAPSITATGLTTFCQGGSTILTSSAGSTYLWSTGQTTQSITVSVAGSYWVKITNANGCESPASVPTVVSVNPLPAAPVVTNTGATTFCIGGSVNLTSSTGTSYLWSGGLGTNQTITVTTSGTYSVQVYDANGCLSPPSADVTVTVNALPSTPTINASGPLTFCAGNTVDLTCQQVSTGYEWSTSATTQTITIGASGSYSVRRINANGCISAWSTPVNVIVNPIPATPTITASGATTFCQGNNVILTSSSATGNLWSNGATTQSITVTTTNTYTVTVTQSGCTSASASQSVLVNPLPITPNITSSGATTFCSGFYVDLIAAPSGYDYNWSTGGTNQSISVSTSGAYTVSITDVNGCTSPVSAPMNVTVNPLPATPTITTSGSTTFCSGGFVTLTAPTSTGYLWSTSAPTQSINVTTSGTYTVQVTDINGCQSAQSASVTVTVNPLPPAPTITAGGPTTFCAGGSVSLSSTPGSTYTWSNSSNTQSINVNTSGTYTAQITDANGCLSPASNPIAVTVNPLPATPIISSSGSNTFCDGDFVTLTAPTASSYAWSTGEITQSINVSLTGGYTVVITDANGCVSPISAATNITVNPIPAAPSITPTGPTTFCAGNNVILNSSVTTGNLWSTNATTQSITVTASGTYTLTQTLLGCTSPSASINITVNPIPPAPIVTTSGVTTFCDGGSVSLTSSISGNITWSTSETSTSITATTSGLYTVTQTVLGCVSNPSIPVNVVVNPIPAVPTITASGLTTFCAGNTITLTSSAPTGNLWSNGSTNQSITVGTTGSYFVQVILSGCSSGTSAPSTVTVNPLPNAPTIVTGTTESICDGSSVTLTSSSTGGNTWSTGLNTQSISVSAAGSYTVQVTDGNGCTSPPSIPTIVTVNPLPAAPIISTNVAPVLCYGEQVDLTSSYPTGNIWSSGSTAPTITVSTAGSFTVTHTDANGCVSLPSTTTTVVVNPIPPAPVITPVGSTTFCQGGSVDLVSSEASGNLWSNGLSTSTISPTTSGVYTVMFVDANGCSSLSSLPVVVSVLANPPAPSISAGGPTTVCQGTPVNLVSSYTSGNLWSTGSTMQSINVTTSGSYTVTYTNVNGCSSVSAPMIITVTPTSPIPTISASGSTTICEGSSVTLTSSDPSSTWSTGAGAQSITVSNSGSYFVIGNSTGCASPASAPIVVTVNPSPAVPLITPSGPTTICQGDELFLFTSASGTIQWSTGYTGPVLAISNPGTYFVNVENAYGCTSSSVLVDVVINSLPNVAMNPFATVCTNTAPFTLSNGVPSGGSYSGNGITSNVFNPAVMGAGASIVTYVYTDINGCSAQAQSIITVSNCLGIDENSKEFALYPNPTDGRFVITSEGVPMDNIVIYDAQGKMVYNESYSGLFTLEFNLNDYSNGVYYIEIISNSEVQNRMPLVINH